MATLAELDALVDANPDAARGIAAAYEVLLGGVPSIDGFVFLINNAKATNFGSNNPNVVFNQENIFINLTNALVQGNPAAKAGFDAITAGAATLGDKLAAIYDAFVPVGEQSDAGRDFFTRAEAQTFYMNVAAQRGVAGPDGAAIVGLASLLKILVTEDSGIGDSVNDLIAAINDGSAALPTNGALTPIETADGTHFDDDDQTARELTSGVDTVNGSAGNDYIVGDVQPTALLPIQTLNSGDSINGGGGRDIVKAQLVDFLVQPTSLMDVEVLNLENAPIALGLAVGPRVVDAINANAIDEIGFRSPNANIITGLGVINVASDVTEINVEDSFGLGGPANHFVNFIGTTVRDSVDVNIDNVINTALTLLGGGYETVNLNSGGPVPNSFALIVAEMETLNISGNADLVVLNDLEIDPLGLVDASTFTGDLTIELDNNVDAGLDGINDVIEVRGGAGDDTIRFDGPLDSDATASGGAGDDVIRFEDLGNGDVSFGADDSVDGGAGDDILDIEFNDGPNNPQALLAAGVGANIVGIERIRHSGNFGADDLTIDWTRKGSATELELAADYDSENVTITGLTNADTVFYTGDDIFDLSLTSLNGAGSLSNTINLTIVTTDPLSRVDVQDDLIVDPETELLNLVGTGLGYIEIDEVNQVDSNVAINSTARLSFGNDDAYDFDGGTIDGSASTGDLDIFLGGGLQSASGGSGDDLIVLETAAVGDQDLVVLGAGGADTVRFTDAFGVADDLEDTHRVTGFAVADDVVQLDDGAFGIAFTDTAGNALTTEPFSGRDIVAGEVANLSLSTFGFLKFTTAVAGLTGTDEADDLFGQALGAGVITVGAAADGVLGLAYDSTAGQMVVFEIDSGGATINAADDALAIARVDMTYADFLAFNGANIDFLSIA